MSPIGDAPFTDPEEPGERVKAPLLAEKVYDQLIVRIASGEFRPNTRLPPEYALAAMLGVSRPILRTALGRLRSEGIIVSRQGAGSFVRERSVATLAFTPVETIADIQRCYEFRLTLEPHGAFHAAIRHNAASLGKMETALDLLNEATRNQSHREDADFSFHLAVAEAANNHYFTSTLQALRDHIYVGMHMHGLSLTGTHFKLQTVLEEHRAIYKAIAAGNADGARHLMTAHLGGSRDRLFEGKTLDLRMER